MRVSKAFIALAIIPATAGVALGEYTLRWISVLFLSLITVAYLFSYELKINYAVRRGKEEVRRKSEFERTLNMVKKAQKGAISRSLVEENIIEIYMALSDSPAEVYQRLHAEPNEALRELRKGGDFLDNLERALRIVEGEINEGGGSQLKGKPDS
ncbi:hypothetical protein [Thermococcus waiotapuensis]|uniref:Uncharacterized protein n=1 Tax=Thermococcus waiotapuensis TaxID=90909 RepID=A0AAE4NW54_9EURY|nr:hypothetical protein [Thermococcus waiotapuensis]MDV3103787.1 hypothetical protein [Thermococcus waiotapuensis]